MSGGRTHRPKHNPVLCETCGGCTWQCPATVFPSLRLEEDSLRGALYQARTFPGAVSERPPCIMACPLGQDVPGYVSAIAAEEFERAANIVRDTNAMPSVCGRVCIASCMRACTRAGIDEGIDIRGLKRAAVEIAGKVQIRRKSVGNFKVAVIGSGPTGLAAAHRLIQLGIEVVVYDSSPTPGGALTHYIPEFVLPREMAAGDIVSLMESGVEIKTGVKAGEDIRWAEFEDDFDSVLVATGAGRGVIFNMKGSDLEGVVTAVDFNRMARKNPERIDGSVVVSGGSMSAIQTARYALRLGAHEVTVIHHVPLEQWPAGDHACRFAEEEGVRLLDLHRVMGLEGTGDRLSEVRVKPVKAMSPDDVDRHTLTNYGKETRLEASVFVATQDRRPVPGAQPDLDGITKGVIGNLVVDSEYRLGRPGWYSAGEAATGAATVVDSMGTGRAAADVMSRDLKDGVS